MSRQTATVPKHARLQAATKARVSIKTIEKLLRLEPVRSPASSRGIEALRDLDLVRFVAPELKDKDQRESVIDAMWRGVDARPLLAHFLSTVSS